MDVGEINYTTHSSKTRCVFVDNKDLSLISIDIWCKAGSSFEEPHKNGTAHFLEHMIFKGTKNIMPGEFDYKIESLGGLSNASTGYDDVHYHVLIPPINFRESLALLTNLVTSPNFNIDEFSKEKGVVIDEIKQQNDQPDEKIFNYFLERVWQNSSYSKSILGTEESVKSLDISDLERFHKKYYFDEKICIAIAGNISNDIYKIFNESDLSGLEAKISTEDPYEVIPKKENSNLFIRIGREEVKFDHLEFSRIFMAWSIPSLKNQKKIIGYEILASILSVGRNSKLVKALKEDNNLVESIYADVNAGEQGGILIIEASFDYKDLDSVEKKINQTVAKICAHESITTEEVKKGVNIVRSNYVFNLETSTQLSSFHGNELLWGRKNTLEKIFTYLDYWNNLDNFKEILRIFELEKFTLIASPKK